MHAVDWLPTLMAAVGKPVAGERTDGKIVYSLYLIIYLFIQIVTFYDDFPWTTFTLTFIITSRVRMSSLLVHVSILHCTALLPLLRNLRIIRSPTP